MHILVYRILHLPSNILLLVMYRMCLGQGIFSCSFILKCVCVCVCWLRSKALLTVTMCISHVRVRAYRLTVGSEKLICAAEG